MDDLPTSLCGHRPEARDLRRAQNAPTVRLEIRSPAISTSTSPQHTGPLTLRNDELARRSRSTARLRTPARLSSSRSRSTTPFRLATSRKPWHICVVAHRPARYVRMSAPRSCARSKTAQTTAQVAPRQHAPCQLAPRQLARTPAGSAATLRLIWIGSNRTLFLLLHEDEEYFVSRG